LSILSRPRYQLNSLPSGLYGRFMRDSPLEARSFPRGARRVLLDTDEVLGFDFFDLTTLAEVDALGAIAMLVILISFSS
jgi:hypothetical protein